MSEFLIIQAVVTASPVLWIVLVRLATKNTAHKPISICASTALFLAIVITIGGIQGAPWGRWITSLTDEETSIAKYGHLLSCLGIDGIWIAGFSELGWNLGSAIKRKVWLQWTVLLVLIAILLVFKETSGLPFDDTP